jgi:uncharacterized protein (DUF608 family)
VNRRVFLTLGAVGIGAMSLPERAAAAMGISSQNLVEVPTDKDLSPEFVASLTARGVPTEVTGAALGVVGMPVGGGCAGQVYLSGDGRLWLWDVDNPRNFRQGGAICNGPHYVDPLAVSSPFRNGFAVRVTGDGPARTKSLDSKGFGKVSFVGRYPVGRVEYADHNGPLTVSLEATSTFVPTSVADSTVPAVCLSYTLRNTGHRPITATIAGWTDSPVNLDSRSTQPIILRSKQFRTGDAHGVEFSGAPGQLGAPREDIMFEDWERSTYAPWTVEGTAFGPGPLTRDEMSAYMKGSGDMHVTGDRFVTSQNFRGPAGDTQKADDETGKLTSPPFTITRRYVAAAVGGGAWIGEACLNVLVGEKTIASFTGSNSEPMLTQWSDVSAYEGQTATIEIVDNRIGGWGHVNCDRIWFTDKPAEVIAYDDLPDHGTFALAATEHDAFVKPSIAGADSLEAIFDGASGPTEIAPGAGTITAAVGVPVHLRPGQSRTVRFVLSWFFPKPSPFFSAVNDYPSVRKHYQNEFSSASAVIARVSGNTGTAALAATRLWEKTWYADSTLPHWFLERTLAPASTLATMTCQYFANGRFYAEEGIYSCDGTCQHVWGYAQSVARLFPELERSAREIGDLGTGFDPVTGQMGFRQEADRTWAADGQSGTILRIYREHLMSVDDSFLRRVWPKTKLAIQFLINQDAANGHGADGVLEGRQHNTLDQDWYGEIPWLTGLYVAMLRAAAAMAGEVGDTTFAASCQALADKGSGYLNNSLWNDTYGYFEQKLDQGHLSATNSNRGCFIDQLFGQNYALALDLPRVFDKSKTDTALRNIYRNNFLPDPAAYAKTKGIKGPRRIYNEDGEPGTIMCTWPYGGNDIAPGGGIPGLVGYFDEVWTGQEYQLAAHLIGEGLVTEGLAVTRAVHDRYSANKRNPYNEIECSDHYSRAMMSHGVYLAACGYSYHGPRGHLGFAPKITPENFAAAFTVAAGWGSYRQTRRGNQQVSTVELRYGTLKLRSFGVQLEKACRSVAVNVRRHGHQTRLVRASLGADGDQTLVTFDREVDLVAGDELTIVFAC